MLVYKLCARVQVVCLCNVFVLCVSLFFEFLEQMFGMYVILKVMLYPQCGADEFQKILAFTVAAKHVTYFFQQPRRRHDSHHQWLPCTKRTKAPCQSTKAK